MWESRCREKLRISEDNRNSRLGQVQGPFSWHLASDAHLEMLESKVNMVVPHHISHMGFTPNISVLCVQFILDLLLIILSVPSAEGTAMLY